MQTFSRHSHGRSSEVRQYTLKLSRIASVLLGLFNGWPIAADVNAGGGMGGNTSVELHSRRCALHSSHTAIDRQNLACYIAGSIRGKKDGRPHQIFFTAQPP